MPFFDSDDELGDCRFALARRERQPRQSSIAQDGDRAGGLWKSQQHVLVRAGGFRCVVPVDGAKFDRTNRALWQPTVLAMNVYLATCLQG